LRDGWKKTRIIYGREEVVLMMMVMMMMGGMVVRVNLNLNRILFERRDVV